MELPSGRVMRYQDVRRERRMVVQEEGAPPKARTVYTADTNGRRTVFYGGMLLENCVQATAREVFAGHLLGLNKLDCLKVLFSSHDEAVTEADLDASPKTVEQIMSKCPDWLEGCPIAAEAFESPHYKK